MPRSDRLFALANLLAGPRRRRLEELTRELETSARSIYRDLADLESRGIPIERVSGTYRFMEGATMRPLQLTPRERLLLTLCLENPALQQPAFAETMRQLRAKVGAANSDPPVAVLAGPDRSGELPREVAEAIENAIRDSHSVSMLYTSLSDGKARWRGVDPWAIFHRSEAWYLVGRCHTHDGPRTFRMDRVEAVLPIGESFIRPEEFDVESWLGSSWGVLEGEATEEAVVVFDRSVAPLVEHARHHPFESKLRLEDGRLEYRVRVGHLEELARWVVGFGGKAQAIEPPELVESVRAIAGAAAAAHPRERVAAMVRRKR